VLDRASGLATAHALIVAPGTTEELWVAFGKTPFEDTPHALQLIRDGKVAAAIDLPVADAQAIGDILPQPGSDKAFVATRFGVFEVDASGRFERRSQHAVTRLFRNAQTGLVAAVGSTVEQLVDGRFEPLLFQARAADGSPPAGHPVDVVVDERGRFLLLYSGGQVVLLDERRERSVVLGPEHGIPESARRFLYVPARREVLLGSAREGVVSLRWP
jgi:hypothetical protein